jgi:hypothetical protein
MGLIGLLITVLIMILGMGYYFFGTSHSPFSVTNDSVKAPIIQELEQGQSALQAARDVKNLVEQKAADTMQAGETPAKAPVAPPAQKTGELKIVNRLMSVGFSVPQKARLIDTVVLHSSYNNLGGDVFNIDQIFKEWQDAQVAPHYFIDREGIVYRTVDEKNIAYHAGVSKMADGRTNVNDFSIGIELDGSQTSGYTDKQYTSLNALIADIKTRNTIKFVVGHSDIAPGRKTDPWNFDWKKLK